MDPSLRRNHQNPKDLRTNRRSVLGFRRSLDYVVILTCVPNNSQRMKLVWRAAMQRRHLKKTQVQLALVRLAAKISFSVLIQLNRATMKKWKLISIVLIAAIFSSVTAYFLAGAQKNHELGVSASISLVERTLVRDAIVRGDISKAIELSDVAMYGDVVKITLADTRSEKTRPASEQRQRERSFILAKQSWLNRPIERLDLSSVRAIAEIFDGECKHFGAKCPEGIIESKKRP